MSKTRREHIMATVTDMITCLLYYDRKEDEDLPVGAIEAALTMGEVTVDEIAAVVKMALERAAEEYA